MFGLGRRELIIFAIVITAIIFGTGYRLAHMKSVLDEETSFVVNEKGGKVDPVAAGAKTGAGNTGNSGDTGSSGENSTGNDNANSDMEEIVVHITGAVKKPGVYSLPAGSRVIDALNLAVPAAEADIEQLNLAVEMEDGEQIQVPHRGETADNSGGSGGSSAGSGKRPAATGYGSGKTGTGGAAARISSGKVNINKAGIEELDTLPGIGPALAQRILDYRAAQGKFQDVSELKNVSGIGDKKYAGLAEMVTLK